MFSCVLETLPRQLYSLTHIFTHTHSLTHSYITSYTTRPPTHMHNTHLLNGTQLPMAGSVEYKLSMQKVGSSNPDRVKPMAEQVYDRCYIAWYSALLA